MTHGKFAIELGQLQVCADGLETQLLSDMRELNITVIAGVKIQRAGYIRDGSVIYFAIYLYVAGHRFYIYRTIPHMKIGISFYGISGYITAVRGEIDVAVSL